WIGYLRQNVSIYALLTAAEQERLHNDMRVFLAEKNWEGCRGLVITDEIKVTISAQACILLLGLQHDYFSQVKSILVYPTAFQNPNEHLGSDGLVHEGIGLLGEAWRRGPVFLAWDDVLAGERHDHDGRNVVLHEFTHQLDFLGDWSSHQGQSASRAERAKWQRVLTDEYERLVRDTEHGKATLLDKY